MATHYGVLARRIPGTGEPHGLPSLGSHRAGHDAQSWTRLKRLSSSSNTYPANPLNFQREKLNGASSAPFHIAFLHSLYF